jgi:phenylalanyl-tRNA synthetase beta chain
MIFSRNLITKILPEFKNISDAEFQKAVLSTGNELPSKDIFKHPTLNNVVIGKLVSFEKHPDSDHMNVCKVQTSESDFRTIVCGAGNLVASKHIIVALPGAKLHDGRLIEEKDLRGVKSQGMICSYNELTPLNSEVVSKLDAEGVMLFEDGIIGDTNVAKFLGLDDTLYQIEVPYSNRHDIEGALAFCQDIAAYFNWKID